jgi:hypothetical protein
LKLMLPLMFILLLKNLILTLFQGISKILKKLWLFIKFPKPLKQLRESLNLKNHSLSKSLIKNSKKERFTSLYHSYQNKPELEWFFSTALILLEELKHLVEEKNY